LPPFFFFCDVPSELEWGMLVIVNQVKKRAVASVCHAEMRKSCNVHTVPVRAAAPTLRTPENMDHRYRHADSSYVTWARVSY
jgi:hypothetical protein